MPRIVLDTNVLISSLIKRGKSRELTNKIAKNRLTLVLSQEILSEFIEVMDRDKFRKYATKSEVKKFTSFLLQTAEVVKIKSNFRVVKEDPKDDVVLNTAFDGRAEYIASGDEHLLKLKRFKGVKILSVAEMLEKIS